MACECGTVEQAFGWLRTALDQIMHALTRRLDGLSALPSVTGAAPPRPPPQRRRLVEACRDLVCHHVQHITIRASDRGVRWNAGDQRKANKKIAWRRRRR